MPRGRLIINADDLGIHPSINDGIRDAYERGILTSASMLVTTPFLRETVETVVRRTTLPTGLHLSLTLGKALTPPELIPDLVDESGSFKHPAPYFILLRGSARAAGIEEQIRRELETQFAAARDSGISLSHVDSHQHVHMNPRIFAIVEMLAERFGVRSLRFSREPFLAFEFTALLRNSQRRNLSKLAIARICATQIRPRLKTPDWFFGLAYSGEISPRALLHVFDRVGRTRTTCEIGIHPGYPASGNSAAYIDPAVGKFIAAPSRRAELDLLLDPQIRAELDRRQIALTSFRDLAA